MAETYEIRSIFESSYIVAEFTKMAIQQECISIYLIENYGIGGMYSFITNY